MLLAVVVFGPVVYVGGVRVGGVCAGVAMFVLVKGSALLAFAVFLVLQYLGTPKGIVGNRSVRPAGCPAVYLNLENIAPGMTIWFSWT